MRPGIRHSNNRRLPVPLLLAAIPICLGINSVSANTVVSAVSGLATSTFISSKGNNYSINNTINQSGLSTGYVSGVTDFDAYLATNPTHASTANGAEWFSKNGDAKGVSVTYDLGRALNIDAMALWNEEFAGLGHTNLLGSLDGVTYVLLSTILPADSPYAVGDAVTQYSAQKFSFLEMTLRYLKLDILDCPGPPPDKSNYRGCGIGEVAFSASEALTPVPLPGALSLLGPCLAMLAWRGRRKALHVRANGQA